MSDPVEPARWPSFWKVEGLGNDFVLVDLRDGNPDPEGRAAALAARAAELCDRNRGIGADGLLLVLGTPERPRMRVVNRDGSVPEMCGNGLRCVALYDALASGRELPAEVVVDTDAGPRPCTVLDADGGSGAVRADMGAVRVLDAVAPAAARGRRGVRVDAGNPHAVFVCDAGEDPDALARALGPGIETDPAFPAGANVEFVAVEAPDVDPVRVRCVVWERGCGITQACGTGACAAAAVVAARTGASRIEVHLPGGPLTVDRDGAGRTFAEGPARLVFLGRWAAGRGG